MKISRGLAACGVVLSMLLFTGCQRSTDQVWEDTKTGGNYVGKGFRSAGGKHGSSRQVTSAQDMAASDPNFIPLQDEDMYQKLVIGDPKTLSEITAYSSIPHSRYEPGEAGSPVPGIDGFQDPSAYHAEAIFVNIHFDTDDYVVRGRENREIIQKVAQYLKEHPSQYVFIEGHCDERNTSAYNMSLGAKRSNSIRALLVKEGVNLNNVFTISYGKERPLVLGHSEEQWKVNRRGQFKLYDTQQASK